VPRLPYEDMSRHCAAEPSAAIRARVETARARQRQRGRGLCNAAVAVKQLRDFCTIDSPGRQVLGAAVARLHLSARAHDRILRVARTLADLDGLDAIAPAHLAEAIGYRSLDRSLWEV